jgi:carboxyl-terminal processing protease
MSPFDGTPAHRGGIRYGDQIVQIDGESTETWTSLQVSQKLIGPEGTSVTVKVARLGVSQPVEFKFVREAVPLPSVTNYYMAGNGIGYINFERGFNFTSYDEIHAALADLQKQGLTSLILDLRGNPGGLVDQARKITNLFLYRGQPIVTLRGRPQVLPNREETATNNNPEEFPVVVLINSRSASASEIVAGALQDHDRAVIVGENSFGKGLVQSAYPLSDGSGLWLVTGHFYTPSGRLIQRDYSGVSLYDYYFNRNSDDNSINGVKQDDANREVKLTDSGRTVYGGGGISPDVKFAAPKANKFQEELLRKYGFFNFGKHYAISHKIDKNFQVDGGVLREFRAYLTENKIPFTEKELTDNNDWVRSSIKSELFVGAFGQQQGMQVQAESDQMVLKALELVPKAKDLADSLRKRGYAVFGGH